ncbi:Haloacid dehalogenase-like hydrolase domain-containing protein 3 [Tieghemiomyces parasiticus]|uniref:Haloacid dehalogenase-like hydrolase domain-containing protein 3 n=1 Tax=Tieghemiomyces parasiticus TaxID=78921 RepID=A0A9W7ZLL4_9FUNG|nr:Haloacid dehalogenase-like hydrolase domain-containing protein 3 [Tieghemiomyces parasiticus]
MGLGSWMEFILLSATFGKEKPDLAIYREALRLGHVNRPEEALHVGDHYENDFIGPRKLSMHSLLLDRTRTDVQGDPDSINDLRQIFDYLDN